jgi:hypothetical protein
MLTTSSPSRFVTTEVIRRPVRKIGHDCGGILYVSRKMVKPNVARPMMAHLLYVMLLAHVKTDTSAKQGVRGRNKPCMNSADTAQCNKGGKYALFYFSFNLCQ